MVGEATRKVNESIIFDDIASLFHLALGIVAGTMLIIVLSIVIVSVYTVYQWRDKKDTPEEKLGDFVELIVGFLIGDIIVKLITVNVL